MKNITAIVLAAGESSRFYPFNNEHKSMVKIMGEPILSHTLKSLKKAGIEKVVIVTSESSFIKNYFGQEANLKLSIDYVIQSEALGMGDAILRAYDFVDGDFLVLNAHRVDAGNFIKPLLDKKKENTDAVLLVKRKENTSTQGVLRYEKDKVMEVIEKPQKDNAPSNLCVSGIYLFSSDFLQTLKNTPKEHYQLEKAISNFAKTHNVSFVEAKDEEVVTLKYPWDLLSLKNYLLKNIKRSISKNSQIAKSAEIIGEVVVEDNVSIMEGVRIKGPCFVGKKVKIGNNAMLRNGVDVEENCLIGAYMEVKNSVIMENSTTHSGFIGDSIIGKNCKIAAQFCTGNVRLDRQEIKAIVKNIEVDTSLKYLGGIIGDDTNIGIKVSTMPGVIIGRNVTVGPSTAVMKNVQSDTKYYAKFQEIVTKKIILRQAQDLSKPLVLFDIDYTLFDTAFFKESKLLKHKVYKEVTEVLDSLNKIAILGVFSEGDIEFQKKKLKETNIEKYFAKDHTHIVLKKIDELKKVLEKYRDRQIFFVDDKLNILYDAKKLSPRVFTIWVKRGFYAQNQKPIPGFKPGAEVLNLREIVDIIKRSS